MIEKQVEELFHRRKKQNKKTKYKTKLDEVTREKIIREIIVNTNKITFQFHDKVINEENHLLSLLYKEFVDKRLRGKTNREQLNNYLRSLTNDELLSAIELYIKTKIWSYNSQGNYQDFSPTDIVESLNIIFRIEHVGFHIIPSKSEDLPFFVVPFKSKYVFEEITKKTMNLLNNVEFDVALTEFEKSIIKFRENEFEDACVWANKSYESTLKTIIKKIGLNYKKDDKIPKLIDILYSSDLLKPEIRTNFESFWPILKTGPNNIRNLEGIAHGSSEKVNNAKKQYAEFVMHIVATYILFLIENYEDYKKVNKNVR